MTTPSTTAAPGGHVPDGHVPDGRAPAARRERAALAALLVATAVLLLWDLGASGFANSFYSAAAQAGGQSWKAFLFGSLDPSDAITVDKPPASLWPMGLSVRLFGLGAWQILVPQALMGVGTVAVLYFSVRRYAGVAAGQLAGWLLALTPVAALMFRFNNPDALLCLLLVSAVACALRALEDGRTRWLVLTGVLFGFGFLTKTLQAWLILPVLAVLYLVCAPVRPLRRAGQLLLGGSAALVSCGWWVALAELWPAGSRPWIGGSQTDSFLELTLGYNGFGRITGNETGSVGGGPGGGQGGGWGETGLTRLFNSSMGGQISWLLPAALVLLAAGLVLTRRAARTDMRRAVFLAWGGSLLMTAATFSLMSGIFHEYYNIALAPYLAAVVAVGAVALWRERARPAARLTLAGTVLLTAGWSWVLLGRADDWLPWLRWTVLVLGVLAAVALVWLARPGTGGARAGRLAAVAAMTGLAATLLGPLAYTLDTVGTPHTGSIVTAGPSTGGGPGGPGGGPGGGKGGPPGAGGQKGKGGKPQPPGGQVNQAGPGGNAGQGQGGPGRGHANTGTDGGGSPQGAGQRGAGKQGAGNGRGGGPGGGMGGLLNGTEVDKKAEVLLGKDASRYTWAAAAVGAQNAAGYQLSTGEPVMAVGGFNGSDPYPTLDGFRKLVEQGKIHYFVGGSGGGPGGGRGTSAKIASWVEKNFTAVKAGSATLYDLTDPT